MPVSDCSPHAPPGVPLRRLATASVINLGQRGISAGLGVVTVWLLTGLLGAERYGVYAFAVTVATTLAVFTRLGLDSLLTREVAVAHQTGANAQLRGMVQWGFGAAGLAAVATGAAVVVVAWLTAAPSTAAAVTAAMVMLVPLTWLEVPAAVLRGMDRPVWATVPIHLVRPLVFGLGVGALVALGITDPVTAVWMNAVAHGVALLTYVRPWRRHRPPAGPAARIDPVRFFSGAPSLVLVAGLSVVVVHADVLMLKGLASDAEVGIYAVVAQLVRLVGMPLSVVNRVVGPPLAAAHAQRDLAALQRIAGYSSAGITAVTVPVALSLALGGAWVLGWFGATFRDGLLAMQILLAGQVVNALCGSVGTVLLMMGRERELGVVSGTSAAMNILLNLVLIPPLGMVGAALASAASLVLFNVALVVRVRFSLGLDTTVLGLWRAS